MTPLQAPRSADLFVALALLALAGCATAPVRPTAERVASARGVRSYTAELTVGLRGPDLRGRARVLVGFVRPDRLRLEVPSPSGARLVLVVRSGRVIAVFPADRAFFEGEATARAMGELTGVSLSPAGVMDLLLGVPPPGLADYAAQWGEALPRRVQGRLDDGTRLDVRVEAPRVGEPLADAAFDPPLHEGYRSLTAAEARDLWVIRR